MDVAEAWSLAERHLAETLPDRWLHVQGVASRAREISPAFGADGPVLEVAAVLHDIGYAPTLAMTGFHQVDGARYLRQIGVDERIVGLVAFHSFAHLEAELRGIGPALMSEFDREQSATSDALCYCDMTTSPRGERVAVSERLVEIQSRYGPDHVVSRFIRRASAEITAAAERTQRHLRGLPTAGQSEWL